MSIEMRIMEAIAEQVGKDVTVEQVEVEKNNGVIRTGFTIKEVGSTLAPTIYFNPEWDEDKIFAHTIDAYKNSLSAQPEFNMQEIFSKDYILANVYPVFANTTRNEKRFDDVLNRNFADDISIIYKVDANHDEQGVSCFTIRKPHLEYLGITEQELHEASIKNIQGKGELIPMRSILGDACPDDCPLMVITSNSGANGASMILDTEVSNTLKELAGDVFIIPSSVHELIAIGCENIDDDFVENISDMIKIVNSTELGVEDYLSDYLYKYTEAGLEKVEVA